MDDWKISAALKRSLHRRDTRKRFLGFSNGVICPTLGRCLLSLSLSQFPISMKFKKVQTLMPHYCCFTPLLSSFILPFRITTTIHSIVQFVIICWKQLSVASQLLLRRHLCLPADVIRRIIDKYAGPSANLEGFTFSLYLLVRFCKVFSF